MLSKGLAAHGMCRMLSLAALKSLKPERRAGSSPTWQEQPSDTGDSLNHHSKNSFSPSFDREKQKNKEMPQGAGHGCRTPCCQTPLV